MKSNITDEESATTSTTTPTASRTGKIARLPQQIRQQLNERLADGEPQQRLVAWLNENKIVRQRLEECFEGRSITEHNLSDWKRGGFLDWQRAQEARSLVREFLSQAEELSAETEGEGLLDRVADVVALVLLKLFQAAAAKESSPEQHKAVLEAAREMARLRRADHQRQRVRLIEKRERKKCAADEMLQKLHNPAWVRDEEEERQHEAFLKSLRWRAENYRSEYVAGLKDLTLTPERKAWIEEFYDDHLEDLGKVGAFDLPHFEDEEDEQEEPGKGVEKPEPAKRKGRRKARPTPPENRDPVAASPE